MSTLSPVLYGKRLPSQTLYSENYDRQSFSVTINDSVNTADAEINKPSHVAADTLTLSDSFIKNTVHAISDSITVSSAHTKHSIHVISDSITLPDHISSKTLSVLLIDTVLLQDWFSISHQQTTIWTGSVTPEATQSLYGRILPGRNLYSSSKLQVWNSQEQMPSTGNWSNIDNG